MPVLAAPELALPESLAAADAATAAPEEDVESLPAPVASSCRTGAGFCGSSLLPGAATSFQATWLPSL